MATWHQEQAARRAHKAGNPIKLWHETKWTVVEDPPNGGRALGRFDSKMAAEANKAGLEKHHPHLRGYVYILPPGGKEHP